MFVFYTISNADPAQRAGIKKLNGITLYLMKPHKVKPLK